MQFHRSFKRRSAVSGRTGRAKGAAAGRGRRRATRNTRECGAREGGMRLCASRIASRRAAVRTREDRFARDPSDGVCSLIAGDLRTSAARELVSMLRRHGGYGGSCTTVYDRARRDRAERQRRGRVRRLSLAFVLPLVRRWFSSTESSQNR